jgi:hypothetical protein
MGPKQRGFLAEKRLGKSTPSLGVSTIGSSNPYKPPKTPNFGASVNSPRYGQSSAVATAGPTAASRFGMPALPKMPAQKRSGVSGVAPLSTANRKSVNRFGI